MIRRQFVFIVLFTVIFQIFFSTTNTLSLNQTQPNEWTTTTTNSTNKCEAASIYEFPPLFFTNEQRLSGGILVHIVLILYSFAAIEIVYYHMSIIIGCCWSDFHGISNISFRIFHIYGWCFLRQIGYCL
jgi:hypothetical protein